MGYAGDIQSAGTTEAEPVASHGCNQFNLRIKFEGTFHLAIILALEGASFCRRKAFPLPSALELVETLPSTPCVEPAVQFTQASLNVRIYLDGEPFPPSLDLQLKEGRLFEDPVRLPVTVSFEQKFAVKVASPMEGIVFPFPFMKRDGAKWLVDFDELCSAPRTPTEIPAVVHDDILNDLEDGFENGSVPTTCCVSADDVAAPPATLDGPIKLCEYETSEIEFAIFSNGCPYLSVCKVALIEHEVSGVWKKCSR